MQTLFQLFTSMEFTKPFALVLFFVTFVGILAYVYLGRERSKRFESYRFIPLDETDNKADE
jgi:cbb3-type cytochrome oxidase subunit 3